MWVGIIQFIEGLNRTKGRGRRNSPLFSASLIEQGHLISSLLSSEGDLIIGSLGSQAFGLD